MPIDFGGSLSTTMNLFAYERLKERLGVTAETKMMSIRSQTVLVDEQILRRFQVDTRGLFPGATERDASEQYPDGSYKDAWGVIRKKPKGFGHYMDMGHPFAGEPTQADLANHRWPDPNDPGHTSDIRARAKALHEDTDYAIVLTLPPGIVHLAQFLRGYEAWLMDLAANPTFFHALMERVFEVYAGIATNMLKAAGKNIDLVWYGDDVAVQNGPLCSLDTYRKHIKPWDKKIFDLIHGHTNAKIIYHCCGSVYQLIPDFLDFGIDALNPVQVAARDMDTQRLKKEFGNKLTFWGGIDTQHVLPHGKPEAVKNEVRHRIGDLAPGGGFVVASVHNIQREVPPENVVAMLESALELGRYPV